MFSYVHSQTFYLHQIHCSENILNIYELREAVLGQWLSNNCGVNYAIIASLLLGGNLRITNSNQKAPFTKSGPVRYI